MASRKSPRRVQTPASPQRRIRDGGTPPVRKSDGWLLFAALLGVTLLAYLPAWHGGPLWDDDEHLTAPALSGAHGLGLIWTDVTATQQYYPVVNTAFWIMNQLWGHDPLGYHLVNITLHALSAFLVAGLLRRWSVPGATVAAVIFALHPVQVETVAWMTELKNTLSGVFYFLALAAYVRFDESRDRRWYAAAIAAFVLALGSKTVTATLPAAILILLWWRRGRIDGRRDVLPLLPLFVIGIAAGAGTAWLEYAWVGANGQSFALSWLDRVLLAGRAAWFYAAKDLWPVNLIFSYPRWSIDHTVWWQYLFPLSLVAVVAALWAIRRRTRAPLAAVLFFGCTLFPALGFMNVFPFKYSYVADHFQYLACLGVFALVASGLVWTASRWRGGTPDAAIAAVVAIPLFVLTWQQSRQYVDNDTLYRTTLARNSQSLLAHINLAKSLLDGPERGWAEGERHARAAAQIAPDDASPHNDLGLVLERAGRFDDAVRELREALRLDPRLVAAYNNLGYCLAALGQFGESATAYETSLKILPHQPDVLSNLATVFMRQQRLDEAIQRFRQAAQMAPDSPGIQMNVANALQTAGRFEESIAAYREALRLQPGWGDAQHNLAMALQRAGRTTEAVAAFEEAARLAPADASAQLDLADALVSLNRLEDAVPHFEAALRTIEPARAPEVHNAVGAVLIRLGQTDAAIRHFEAALALRPDYGAARDNLARARRGR